MGIKTGPKRTNQDGTPDKRQRVTEENKKKHPKLKEHKHEKAINAIKAVSFEAAFNFPST
ncbi:hypothetical protein ABMX90_22225 [Vibrio vulnificus]|uniref:hypothetical protein n=1 Tax=Vibrio vulnificus TaxID=672 RepID=UPI0040580E34